MLPGGNGWVLDEVHVVGFPGFGRGLYMDGPDPAGSLPEKYF